MLGRELLDERRDRLLAENGVGDYAEKGRSAIYWSEDERRGPSPLIGFPELDREYRSPELFALFRNRVMAKGRPDRMDYLSSLDLPEDASPSEILSVNGGTRVTDTYEVFPKLEKGRYRVAL